jgi:hypothetical protein
MNFQQKLDAAENPNTPIHILEQLATDEDWCVRYYAAMNSNATEIVKRLYIMTESSVEKESS